MTHSPDLEEQTRGEPRMSAVRDFLRTEAGSATLLLAATVLALAWANSPWAESYAALWHTKLTVGVGDFSVSKDLTHWINDGLMAVFFLVVGLEIKREVFVGELSTTRNAALPVVSLALAKVLTGGKTDHTETVSEKDLYKLERQVFMELAHHPDTLARMEHMLETGKPLRN